MPEFGHPSEQFHSNTSTPAAIVIAIVIVIVKDSARSLPRGKRGMTCLKASQITFQARTQLIPLQFCIAGKLFILGSLNPASPPVAARQSSPKAL